MSESILVSSFREFNDYYFPSLKDDPVLCGATWGAGYSIAVIAFGFGANYVFGWKPEKRDFAQELSASVGMTDSNAIKVFLVAKTLFFGSILAPIGEELIFRDQIPTYSKEYFADNQTAHLLTLSGLFGAMHMDPRQGWSNVGLFVHTTMMGLFYAVLKEGSGTRDAAIACHLAFNSTAFLSGLALAGIAYVFFSSDEEKANEKEI